MQWEHQFVMNFFIKVRPGIFLLKFFLVNLNRLVTLTEEKI